MSPFVSGLPGERAADMAPNKNAPAGMVLLAHIRALAADEAEQLLPRTVTRFDGVERVPPDPEALARKDVYDAIVRLCDGLRAEPHLQLAIAAMLAGRGK